MSLYISYGSNLNKHQMRLRCLSARPLGKFILTNARLVFRGVADVEYAPGEKCPCGLWSITPEDERVLDAYEGVSVGFYFKCREILLRLHGKERHALIYLMRDSVGIFPPSQSYADTIRRGYQDFGLDERYLDAAIKRAFEDKTHSEQTRARRAGQRRTPKHARLVEMPESVALQRLDMRYDLLTGATKSSAS